MRGFVGLSSSCCVDQNGSETNDVQGLLYDRAALDTLLCPMPNLFGSCEDDPAGKQRPQIEMCIHTVSGEIEKKKVPGDPKPWCGESQSVQAEFVQQQAGLAEEAPRRELRRYQPAAAAAYVALWPTAAVSENRPLPVARAAHGDQL